MTDCAVFLYSLIGTFWLLIIPILILFAMSWMFIKTTLFFKRSIFRKK